VYLLHTHTQNNNDDVYKYVYTQQQYPSSPYPWGEILLLFKERKRKPQYEIDKR
jgi:hypothetical protein